MTGYIPDMTVIYTHNKTNGGTRLCGKESSIKVNGEVFHYWMKQYDKGSEWGIEGGRISKLMLKRNGKIVCNYDRGWDVEPADENTQLALELLLHSENW